MPKVNRVNKCRKDQGSCPKCGKPLPVGSAYIYWKFRYGGTHKRCTDQACYPKPSELTQSEFLSQLYDLQERLQALTDVDEVEVLIQEIRDLGSEQLDKQTNMPEGLQYSDTGQLLEDRANACEDWADEIEAVEVPAIEADEGDEEFSPDEALEQYLDEVRDTEYSGE